jgi:hypothetical protein
MTPVHAIMVLIIRLWAAGVVISSITGLYLWPLLSPGSDGDGDVYATYTVINGSVWVIVGILAWIFSPKFAQVIYRENNDGPPVNFNVDADTLVMIGSFLIGGFYLVEYVPTLFSSTFFFFFLDNPNRDPNASILTSYHTIEQFVIRFLIVFAASWLVFKPAHIARLFSKLRTLGQYALDTKSPPGDKRHQEQSEDRTP